jgi:hypothetical protein
VVQVVSQSHPFLALQYYMRAGWLFQSGSKKSARQMGDYSRDFAIDDAKAWANSYKGETNKVHVDPRAPDPFRAAKRKSLGGHVAI